jgi:hypothetical protein
LSQSKEGEARVVENEREDKDNKEEMMAAEEEAMDTFSFGTAASFGTMRWTTRRI